MFSTSRSTSNFHWSWIFGDTEIGCKYYLLNIFIIHVLNIDHLKGWNTEAHYIDIHSASKQNLLNLLKHIGNWFSPLWQNGLGIGIALDLYYILRWESHVFFLPLTPSLVITFSTEVEIVWESKFERCRNLEKLGGGCFLKTLYKNDCHMLDCLI